MMVRGPVCGAIDNRLLALHLVRIGATPTTLFGETGTSLLASEVIRHKNVLIERGRCAPVTRLNLEMMVRAREMFDGKHATAFCGSEASDDMLEIMEITMNNLRDRGKVEKSDFLARIDLLSAVNMMVLVSDLGRSIALRSIWPRGMLNARGLRLASRCFLRSSMNRTTAISLAASWKLLAGSLPKRCDSMSIRLVIESSSRRSQPTRLGLRHICPTSCVICSPTV